MTGRNTNRPNPRQGPAVSHANNGDWPQTFTALDLAAEEIPPVRWAVPGILPQGVMLLAGKPKMGKSWMGLDLCKAVATGGAALGTRLVEQGESLYLALEDNRRRLQKRLEILRAGSTAPAGLHLTLDWPRAHEGGIEALDNFLSAHPDCRLIVIDTFARFKPRANGKRMLYDEDREAVDPLLPVANDHNVSILLVHHLREADSDDPLDMIHGSAGLTGGVDGALVLKRTRGQADAYLLVDGRDIEESTELALTFDPNTATWTVVGNADEYRMSKGRTAIRRTLENADGPLGPKEIAAVIYERGVHMSYGAVREMLSQMVKDGQAKNLGRGQYVLPDYKNSPDNADILTNGKTNVSMSGMSVHSRRQGSIAGSDSQGSSDVPLFINENGEAEF